MVTGTRICMRLCVTSRKKKKKCIDDTCRYFEANRRTGDFFFSINVMQMTLKFVQRLFSEATKSLIFSLIEKI